MKNSVVLFNIKKREIKVVKKKKTSIIWFMFLFVVAITMFSTVCKKDGSTINVSISGIYNPVNSLYSDNAEIVFTNGNIVEKSSLNLTVPLRHTEYEIINNGINFFVKNNIMVTSCDNGIVEECGCTNDGIKYIKIKHSNNLITVIENLDILGVEKLQIVKAGQDIATAKPGQIVTLKILLNDIFITNLKITNNRIICLD